MSIKLMTLVWDVRFPTQSQLLIALKIADYAADDGGSVFPARNTLAEQAQTSESTVKNVLRAFRDIGLLMVVKEGGHGPKSTTHYQLNTDLLRALASGAATLEGNGVELSVEWSEKGSTITPLEGSTIDPLEAIRGQPGELRGQPGDDKGSTRYPQSINNHQIEPSCARARASHADARASRATASLPIRPGDISWDAWLETLDPSLRDAAVTAGEIRVSKRWPGAGAVIHTKLQPSFTARLTGDAA